MYTNICLYILAVTDTSLMRIILFHTFFWFPNIVLTVFCCAFFLVHLLGSISSRSFVSDCRFCIQSSFFLCYSVFGSIEFNFDRSLILCFFLKFDWILLHFVIFTSYWCEFFVDCSGTFNFVLLCSFFSSCLQELFLLIFNKIMILRSSYTLAKVLIL